MHHERTLASFFEKKAGILFKWVFVNVSAAERRPGLGRQAEEANALGAVLVITLADFAFGSQPVVGFVARLKSAALG
jgi:hypothetical protein